MAKAAEGVAAGLAESNTYSDAERPFVRKIAAFVEGKAKHLAAMATPLLNVDEDLL
jgi:hypothetical protein